MAVNVVKLNYSHERLGPPILHRVNDNGLIEIQNLPVKRDWGTEPQDLGKLLAREHFAPRDRTAIIINAEEAINSVDPNDKSHRFLIDSLKGIQKHAASLFGHLNSIISAEKGLQITQRSKSETYNYPIAQPDSAQTQLEQNKLSVSLDTPTVLIENYLNAIPETKPTTEDIDSRLKGEHFVIELCNADLSDDKKVLEIFKDIIGNTELTKHDGSRAKLNVLGETKHIFEPPGASSVILLAESHASIHTWPRDKYASIDLYTCAPGRDMMPIIERLQKEFGGVIQVTKIPRGAFSVN